MKATEANKKKFMTLVVEVPCGDKALKAHPSVRRGSIQWQCAIPGGIADVNGEVKRKWVTGATPDRVRAKMLEASAELRRVEDGIPAIDIGDTVCYVQAREILAPHGLDVVWASRFLASQIDRLGSWETVLEAVADFAKRHPRNMKSELVSKAVDAYREFKLKEGAAVRYLSDIRSRLGHFAEDHGGEVQSLTRVDILKWIDGRDMAPASKRNYQRIIHTFLEFCKRRGWVSENVLFGAPLPLVRNTEAIETFTSDELRRLLAEASVEYLPCLAIQAFTGVRSAELQRMVWADIRFDTGTIVVNASNAKTRSRRTIALHPTLEAWLKPYIPSVGRIFKGFHDQLYDEQRRTATRTAREGMPAVEWKQNALRHSYASYRLATTSDENTVAREMGNTPDVIYAHYHATMNAEAGKAWFSILPPKEKIERPSMLAILRPGKSPE